MAKQQLTQEDFDKAQVQYLAGEVNRLTNEVVALKALVNKYEAAAEEEVVTPDEVITPDED